MNEETCDRLMQSRDSWEWRPKRCGRPVKENGLCGVHLGADRRRAAAEKKREQDFATSQRNMRDTSKWIADHHVDARSEFSDRPPYGHTRRILINIDELDALFRDGRGTK